VTMLVEDRNADFRIDANNDDKPGWQQIQDFADTLYEHRKEFGIVDIRSIAYPLGMTDRVQVSRFERPLLLKRSQSYYISDKPGFAGQVTTVDVIFSDDPFSPNSMSQFDRLKAEAPSFLPQELKSTGANLDYLGATASIRDLKTVTGEDQVLIDFLVPAVVFLILVVLLRRIATCAYLIFTVYFSYLVTLGVTFVVFYLAEGRSFAGVDWKVPMFLFTILVAVGEDYNILLMTRIEEEQRQHGRVHGIVAGLRKTGGIISSCGIIMAGTFSALLFGTLEGLAQLGFALAFGVLLDTFVVRPILVPAYLVLLHQGWFGALGRFLGAEKQLVSDRAPAVAAKR
jgi:putative drug exporter of the RND superfamily